ncbi:CHASE3 domain-containing protein [Leptolyngbya sp. 7M]|uniref:CHASE3 domain-containing protein n=1 Tax=Leptolyngbya sp. 7M TaxID=2812896 RepID=UPI001B8AC174|nr:CHASE3 domain-containing protein [Leptolyngbya sp. 7M]QYO63247.1 CHASE3 domain-containing protein [Leptolyngbya sp. 7M]
MSTYGPIERLKAKLPPRLLRIYQRYSLGGKRVTVGYAVALMLLGGLGLISHLNTSQLRQSARQVNQTQAAVQNLNDLLLALSEADYSRRGYYLYSDATELETYQTAVEPIKPLLDQLHQSLRPFPDQLEQLEQLEPLVAEYLTLSEQAIAQFQQTQAPLTAQDSIIIQIRQKQRQVRQQIIALRTVIEQTLQSQVERAQTELQSRLLIETLGAALTLLIFSGIYLLLYRQKRRREFAEMQRRIMAHRTSQCRTATGTRSID